MVGEIDAAGEVVSGALLGRALEPRAGEGGDGHGAICLNCGTALIGPHCHQCGQTSHVHRSLGAIGHEILHGVVHFEGKLWRTLPLLAWRPGKLTRRYIDGERARFVSPIALFLFSIFTLFAVFSLFGISPQGNLPNQPGFNKQMQAAEAKARQDRDAAVAARDAVRPGDPRRAALETRATEAETQLRQLGRVGQTVRGPISGDVDLKTGWDRLDHGVKKAIENPSLATYKLQSNSYKFSWALIPLSLPFVWLLFAWRREFHLYDHAVFVTYSIAFMSLLFIVLTLASAIGVPARVVNLAGMVIVPLHFYSQLKDSYGLSRIGAILRTILLLFFSLIVLLVFLLLVLALGVLG